MRLVIFSLCFFVLKIDANKMRAANLRENKDIALHQNETTSNLYSEWSFWSRCMDCFQKRMKICISPKCANSRIYEQKSCVKGRCKRKERQKKQLHIIHLNNDDSHLRQASSRIWSKWSSWSPCTEKCRTHRFRICKKPGRCPKKQQEQTAYCYYNHSNCQLYVLSLLDNKPNENTIYEYEMQKATRRKTNSCGIPSRISKMLKIIGGTESRKHKWPWHVAILNYYMEVFCGGTLIAPKWVLTANHCIRPYLRVRLNEHDLATFDGRELEMTVYKKFPHPKFNQKTFDNDIALLLLPKSVRLPVACLPNKKPQRGKVCSVMGWGKIRSTDAYGINKLHETKLPVVDSNVCRHSYRHFLITSNMLCAGWKSGKSDTCAGDSGGGLICPYKTPTRQTSYTIQGITSFGDGCGLRNKYGIYTNVFNYLDWIYYIMDHYS